MKSLTIQLEMVPFPEPGAPTISAQILPPLAAVDEFLLDDDEALEAGDPHQNTPPQRGGRLTRDDSIAIVRKERTEGRGEGTC